MLAHFTRRIGHYRTPMLVSMVLMLMSVALEVLIPYLMSYIIDHGIALGNLSEVFRIGGLLLLASLSSLAFGLASSVYLARFSAGFVGNIRSELFAKISSFPFENIDKFSSGSLITRLTTDISGLQAASSLLVRVLSRSPWLMLLSVLMAFNMNAQLAQVFLVVLPFLAVLIVLIIRKAFPLFRKALQTLDKINTVMMENLKAIRVVKSFVREDFEIKKFHHVSTEIEQNYRHAEGIIAFFQPSMMLSIYVCTLLILWFGANLIVADQMSVGQLMSFIIYINQILFALIMISMLFITLAMTRASAERIVEVFDEQVVLTNPEHPIATIPDGSITFKDLSFAYAGDKHVLENINLHISSGETIGILGGTGSSKTSLVQLIPRLYDATQGTVSVGGIDVKQLDMANLRDQVSMVLQKNSLFAGSIAENLRWGNKAATQEQLETACRIAQIHDHIASLPEGYDTHVEQGGSNFSGGQRQRLCIARALLKNPQIIIFDDSTSAVDTTTEANIMAGIKASLPHTTKIIISQRIASVRELDRIVLMDNHQILAVGSHAELLANNPIYQEIEASQAKTTSEVAS